MDNAPLIPGINPNPARSMNNAAVDQQDPYMRYTPFRIVKECQIAGLHGFSRHTCRSTACLKVRVTRQPDPDPAIGCLGKAAAIHTKYGSTAP
jgi:hypothetical protein